MNLYSSCILLLLLLATAVEGHIAARVPVPTTRIIPSFYVRPTPNNFVAKPCAFGYLQCSTSPVVCCKGTCCPGVASKCCPPGTACRGVTCERVTVCLPRWRNLVFTYADGGSERLAGIVTEISGLRFWGGDIVRCSLIQFPIFLG